VDFVDTIQLVGGVPCHEVRDPRRGPAAQTDRHARPPGLFVELELAGRVEEPAEVEVAHTRSYGRARHDQAEMVRRAIGDDAEIAERLGQRFFVPDIELASAHAPAAELPGERERALGIGVRNDDLVEVARVGQVARHFGAHGPAAAENDDLHAILSSAPVSTKRSAAR
jgi:hypothetical protein